MTGIVQKLFEHPKILAFILGLLLTTSLAPVFFTPALISFGVLAYLFRKTESYKDAFLIGYFFGFGFYLSGLYWISIGVSVYASEFWWAIPISLFILPAFLSIYTALFGIFAYAATKRNFYILSYTAIWVAFEYTRGYLFTGFPWNLIGYAFSFSDIIIQFASVVGTYGLSCLAVFSFAIFCYLFEKSYLKFFIYLIITLSIWSVVLWEGYVSIKSHHTLKSPIRIRIVQPSIMQSDKWSIEKFWDNFAAHNDLSLKNTDLFRPDIIIWPEAAVTIQPTYLQVYNALKSITSHSDSILITGGVTDNLGNPKRSRDKIYASIYAIDQSGQFIFDYHKSHLVPFGEYVPFQEFLPIKKLTPGIIPYTPGDPGFIVYLDELNLRIRPLLCYEIIFPNEVRMSNRKVDIILNLTNDAYYGVSSGPYQHFYMARMRAVENGLPLIRAANNGISAMFDPQGRIVAMTNLNDITNLDIDYFPLKSFKETIYSQNGERFVWIFILSAIFLTFAIPYYKKLD
jgi:apolipoprotein N-acyltransferase